MTHDRHTKIAYASRKAIQQAIEDGKLDENDIVFTTDTHEWILILEDLSIVPVNCKVYLYSSISEAETDLNSRTDSYAGQVVSIYNSAKEKYQGYLVNTDSSDNFYVTAIGSDLDIDYNNLGNCPIINLSGTISDPIKLSELNDGNYKITGSYIVSDDIPTLYSSGNGNLFIIGTDESVKHIKKITSTEIVDYTISDNVTSANSIITSDWISKQGYATKTYVDAKITALDIYTKEEIQAYTRELLEQELSEQIGVIVDEKIDGKFEEVTDQEIEELF